MHSYAEIKPEIRYEILARQARDVFGRTLGLRDIELRFIAEQWGGDYEFNQIVDGFCCKGGVFVRVGLSPSRLLSVMGHETRHSWQWENRRFLQPLELAERDARLFVYQQQLPTRDSDVQAWLSDREERQVCQMLASYRIKPAVPSEHKTLGNLLWDAYKKPKRERRMATI